MLDLGYVKGPDGTKKRKRVKRVRATQSAAITALDEMKRQHHLGTLLDDKSPRLDDYLDGWLKANGTARWRPTTLLSHEGQVRRISAVLGHIRLDQLRAQHVQAVLTEMAAIYSRNTINGTRSTLVAALKDAQRDDLVQRNAASEARMPRHVVTATHKANPLTMDELPRFLNAAKHSTLGDLFTFTVMTGLRSGEARGLRWRDVDMDAGVLQVRYQLQDVKGGGYDLMPPKSDSGTRTIPLPPEAVAALKRQHRRQLEDRVLSGGRWHEAGFVFHARNGKPLSRARIGKEYNSVMDAAGIPRRRFHDLRHSCASYLISNGADLMTVKELMGHASIQMTADVYGHLFPNRKVEAMAAWSRLHDATS